MKGGYPLRIDFHTHVFPDKLAEKALTSISEHTGAPYFTNGTVADTDEKLKEWNVDSSVALHIATNPKQQYNVNTWAAEIQTEKRFCFGSIHPDAPDALSELERIKTLGLYGVKLHTYFQSFNIDDKKMFPIYDCISSLKLPLLLHVGFDPSYPGATEGVPQRLITVLENFPHLTMIAAHMGGLGCYQEAQTYLLGKSIYIDTAIASQFLTPELFHHMVSKHDSQRILFGSDCPWSSSLDEAKLIEQSHLSSEQLESIFYKNAQRVLHIQ